MSEEISRAAAGVAEETGRPMRVIENLSKSLTDLASAVGLRKGRENVLEDEPAKPDGAEFLDDTEEGEQRSDNEEVEASRFKSGEPRDRADESAERENGRRQERLTHRSKSRRDEEDDNAEDLHASRKSRRGEDDEDEREERKSRRRKSRGDDDDDEREERKSRARKSEGDWDDEDDALHGEWEDPADKRAEGADDSSDDTIITNQGRRMKGDKRSHEKSLREVYYKDLAKSGQAVRAIEASDVLDYLATVVGDALGGLDEYTVSVNKRLGKSERMQRATAAAVIDLAKLTKSLYEMVSTQVPQMPAAGVALTDVRRRDNTPSPSASKYTPSAVRKALLNGIERGVVDSNLAASFDSITSGIMAGSLTLEQWVKTNIPDDTRAALGL